ncbi:MAG: NUDIX hydrolase [Cereibacter sphaeroides]|uniref:NUDIX hydrolase n=1 Tax=Cereibacter sphaeroides TaxID=1063 RepID=A0A2W5RYS9_CERSP|nr:MAG: NUDIX hydrolase [Cereibacter sphaeroides]
MDEAEFLKGYDPTAFDRPSVAIDLVLLGIRNGYLSALLIQRDQHPFADHWALPGGFVGIAEGLDAAADRVLQEKAGITQTHLEQLYTFGAVNRDPRMRIITVAWLALMTEEAFAAALAANPALLPAMIEVPWAGEAGGDVHPLSPDGSALPVAFDHADILALAILRLRGKLDYSDVGFALLPELFTLRQLQDVHEAILGTPLNKPAFRRRMLDKGWLVATGAREEGTSYRPAELFRFQRPL